MIANAATGRLLMAKYLGDNQKLAKRLEHSQAVGDFISKVANRIVQVNPELNLDIGLCEFLGYCHDIGYSVQDEKHEVQTMMLLQKEGFDPRIIRKAMHGQLLEQFGEKEDDIINYVQYMPNGLEGIILVYGDMSVRVGEPVTIRERAQEIIERIKGAPAMADALKKAIEDNMIKALPRFERYEKIVLALAGLNSAKEF